MLAIIREEMQHTWITILGCVALATVANGFSNGAPPATCGTMLPGHGFPRQTGASPYTVAFNQATYTPGNGIAGKSIYAYYQDFTS